MKKLMSKKTLNSLINDFSTKENLDTSEIMLQLICSIRNLDGRISELRKIIANDSANCSPLKERVKELIKTRLSLSYSFTDELRAFERYIGKTTNISYKNIKRSLKELT